MALTDWLLSAPERGNPDTRIDERHPDDNAWSEGNEVRPLVHGSTYFAELAERIDAAGEGDLILYTDWRGDADEQLTGEPGSEVSEVLRRAVARGVGVHGLLWRSHAGMDEFSHEENKEFGEEVDDRGGNVLLDMRVPPRGSHHQKFVVIRYAGRPEHDVAYVGGIDLCHSRRDDARHLGDPQTQPMAEAYGPTPPWHDVQCAISGPAVYDVETVFRERWEDPAPLTRSLRRHICDRRNVDVHAEPLPAQAPPPPAVPGGTHVVQLLRTYARRHAGQTYPFARRGERSVAHGYAKAFEKARHLIYVEDQYLWSGAIADSFVESLKRNEGLHMVVVLPRWTDSDNLVSRLPQLLGRQRAMTRLAAAAPGRVAFYSPENEQGTPVYVHAKVCVVDDLWCTVGSDNFSRRSWTHDSELSAVVVDTAATDHSPYARRLRLVLASEHLGRGVDGPEYPGDVSRVGSGGESLPDSHLPDNQLPASHLLDDDELVRRLEDCVDAEGAFRAFAESAAALEQWHRGGRRGERPPGRLRPLRAPRINPLLQALAAPVYLWLHDPDGRPWALRFRRRY